MMEWSGGKGEAPSHMPWYKGNYEEGVPYLGCMNVGGRNYGK